MKFQILAALTCCTVAGLALADSTPKKKAAVPATKTAGAPSAAQKSAAPKVVAKKTLPNTRPPAVHATLSRPTTAQPTTAAHPSATAHAVTTTPKTGTYRGRYAAYRRPQPVRRYPAQPAGPTADRYREIQDALAARGYLTTPSTGVWDKDSMDAMQRFQKDQNLDPTGKLTARSLVALGLGPKPQETSMLPPNPPGSLSANPTTEGTPLQ